MIKKTKWFNLCNYPILKKLIINCENWGPVFMLACEIMVGISSLVTDFSEEYMGNIYFFTQLSTVVWAQGYLCLCTVCNACPSDSVTQWGSRNHSLSLTRHHRHHRSCEKYSKAKLKCISLKTMAMYFVNNAE